MQIQNSYYYFKEALSPEICQKIIDMGNSKIESEKAAGYSTEATTAGDNHKQALEKEGLKVEAQYDKTNEQVKTEMGISASDVEKSRYIQKSCIS